MSADFAGVRDIGTRGCHRTAAAAPRARVARLGWILLAAGPLLVAMAGEAAGQTWTPTGSLTLARYRHTATLLADGRVLAAGGFVADGDDLLYEGTAEIFDPATGMWTPTASMHEPRGFHTAVQLRDGRVLVAGGYGPEGVMAGAETYDSATATWTSTGAMQTSRWSHTATLLSDGRVLVAGGDDEAGATASAEVYDPSTGVWTSTGALVNPRTAHVACLLADGRVLVAAGAGGVDVAAVSRLEIYDPQAGAWSEAGLLSEDRYFASATLLRDSRVLIVGGVQSNQSAELYDPVLGTSALTAPPIAPHAYHTATLLPDGRVLVAGGNVWPGVDLAELYDPATGTWTSGGTLAAIRADATATLLADGRVLVAAGTMEGTAEIFDYAGRTWTATGSLAAGRHAYTITPLDDGRVLAAGGEVGVSAVTAATAIYASADGTWTPAASMATARAEHTTTRLADGRLLVVGGRSSFAPLASAELYDPATNVWTSTGSLTEARHRHTATLLPDGRVLVAGGACYGNSPSGPCGGVAIRLAMRSVEIFDPVAGTWTTTGPLNLARASHVATLLRDGRVFVAGHGNGSTFTVPPFSPTVETYDPATGVWSPAGALTVSRSAATATLLGDGRVLVAGGQVYSPPMPVATAEIYDPATATSSAVADMSAARVQHTATRLPDGQILVVGGGAAGAEIFNAASGTWTSAGTLPWNPFAHAATLLADGRVLVAGGSVAGASVPQAAIFERALGFQPAWRPQITAAPATIALSVALVVGGTGFTGPEGSDGRSSSSATNYPLVQVRHVDSQQTRFLPVGADGWSDTSFTSAPTALSGFPRGQALLTVFTNGIPSVSHAIIVASATTTQLTGAPFVVGAPADVLFRVIGQAGDVPLGSVTVSDGATACTAPARVGRCTLTFVSAGPRTLTASYTGGGTLLPSTSAPIVVTVTGMASVTAITRITPASPAAGVPVTVTWSVAGPVGVSTPTGTVTVSDGVASCSASVEAGQCTLTFATSGARVLTAAYSGDLLLAPSMSAPSAVTVGPRVYTLAEGSTGTFFDTYILIANPGAADAPVRLTFLREEGAAVSFDAVVPAHARVTQRIDDVPDVGASAFATVVASLSGAPLLVERATYFGADYRAGHVAAAQEGAGTAWHFAEGVENDFFDTYLLVANADAVAAIVTVTYLVEGAPPVTRTYTAPAAGRLTISTALVPELAGRAFGMRVTSTAPITAERSVYFGDDYRGGHAASGIAAPSTTWLFAEGATGQTFDAFVTLANPGATAATVTLTYHTETGAAVTRTHAVPAESRVTVAIDGEDPALADATFWIEVQADRPIVAERAMYWSANGAAAWTEGHVSAGATAAAPQWGFAEGIVGGGVDFKTFLLLANPGASPATVRVQYLPTDGSPIEQTYTVLAGARTTISVESVVPALRDVPFGMVVTAIESGAIVAERSIYWTKNGPHFAGGTNALGLPQGASR